MNLDNVSVPHVGGPMNGASSASSSGTNDILKLLLQQQYQLTQQQQQFRWHQQQYLGSHTNRQPNHDELFEMAGMLLSDPPASTSRSGSTPVTGAHHHDSMSLVVPIYTITPANSIRGDESDTTASATLTTTTTKNATNTGGMKNDVTEGEVGLFDEDELDEVLGDQGTTTNNDSKSPTTTTKKKGPSNPTLLTTPLPSPINFLAEKTLGEILHSNSRKRLSELDEDSPLSVSDPPIMDNEAEWYLIDFGDDHEQDHPDFLSEGERPIKRSRSFETSFSAEY